MERDAAIAYCGPGNTARRIHRHRARPACTAAGAGRRDRRPTRPAQELSRQSACPARLADAAGSPGGAALELLALAGGGARGVRPPRRAPARRRAATFLPADDPASGGYFLSDGAGLGDDLHAARLRAVFALLRREAHLGADGETF